MSAYIERRFCDAHTLPFSRHLYGLHAAQRTHTHAYVSILSAHHTYAYVSIRMQYRESREKRGQGGGRKGEGRGKEGGRDGWMEGGREREGGREGEGGR